MKKFWQCSEFYAAIIPAIFGILITTGTVTPEKATALQQNILAIIGALLTIVPTVVYSNNRTQLKQSIVNAVGYEGNSTPVTPVADGGTVTSMAAGLSTVDKIRAAGI